MSFANVMIEIAVPMDTSPTERGRVLEKFAKRFLETQNYSVTEEVRLTGMEVDLLAQDNTTSEKILVECKAHRSTISAEILHKLFGQVHFNKYSSGWLISTFALSKDAKGMCEEWETRPPDERRKLQIYDPESLIKRLVGAKIIVSPDILVLPKRCSPSNEAYLLLTMRGEYWAIPSIEVITGIRQDAYLFQAIDGKPISDLDILASIIQTDSSLASLQWPNGDIGETGSSGEQKIKEELQSIVKVPVADHWADYRPARPIDFIGREDFRSSIFTFFDKVRQGETRTRILAIKGPSGWGKSSFVLKIAATAENIRNRKKYFVYPIDSRAATTRRFGELALFTIFSEAVKSGFIKDYGTFNFGGVDSPFQGQALTAALAELKSENKLICLIFDQFEELLYKKDLESIFDEIKILCNSINAAQENIIIGFSWKTDGTIPPEHKAYHLWHSLADHRLEMELKPFSSRETLTALNRFSKELGQPLIPQLKRLLFDNCSGYPWLLKKLCIHILELINNGMDQNDVLVKSLSIQELFKKDIEHLGEADFSCLKQVAADAPAEFFKITNTFGEDIVNNLIGKRLITRSGPRLNIYWDIFRDYLLTEKVPNIPVSYIPQANVARYYEALIQIINAKSLSYKEFAKVLSLSLGATDNLVRDLVNIGHAEADRKAESIEALQKDKSSADLITYTFWKSHTIYRQLCSKFAYGSRLTDIEFKKIVKDSIATTEFTEQTISIYSTRILQWLIAVGLLDQDGRVYILRDGASPRPIPAFKHIRKGAHTFCAETSYENVHAAIIELNKKEIPKNIFYTRFGKNTYYSLSNLGIITNDESIKIIDSYKELSPEVILKKASLLSETVIATINALEINSKIKGEDIGKIISNNLTLGWSRASMIRVGAALKRWAITINQ